MNLEKKLFNTLDGDYWLLNKTASKRNRQKRQMHEFCKKFSAKKRRVVSRQLFQDKHMLSQASQRSLPDNTENPDDSENFRKDVLFELRRLNDKTEKISSRQISVDAWYRYLQHFEQNIAELREILLEKTLPQEKTLSQSQEDKNTSQEKILISMEKQKESLNNSIQEQKFNAPCIERKKIDELQKQDQKERSEIAQTMLELTSCCSAVQNLHYF